MPQYNESDEFIDMFGEKVKFCTLRLKRRQSCRHCKKGEFNMNSLEKEIIKWKLIFVFMFAVFAYSALYFYDYQQQESARITHQTMMHIKDMCDAPIPEGFKEKPPIWLGDMEPYECKKL